MKNKNPFSILGRSKDEDQSGYGGGEGSCGGGEGSCGSSQPSKPGAPPGRPLSPEIAEAAPTVAGLPETLGVAPQTQSLDVKGLAEAMAKMIPQSGGVAAVAPGTTYDQPQKRDENYLDEMGSTWR